MAVDVLETVSSAAVTAPATTETVVLPKTSESDALLQQRIAFTGFGQHHRFGRGGGGHCSAAHRFKHVNRHPMGVSFSPMESSWIPWG